VPLSEVRAYLAELGYADLDEETVLAVAKELNMKLSFYPEGQVEKEGKRERDDDSMSVYVPDVTNPGRNEGLEREREREREVAEADTILEGEEEVVEREREREVVTRRVRPSTAGGRARRQTATRRRPRSATTKTRVRHTEREGEREGETSRRTAHSSGGPGLYIPKPKSSGYSLATRLQRGTDPVTRMQ
ncbi:hypothetical protein KIPB_012108, partial [Kipferlia bialata]